MTLENVEDPFKNRLLTEYMSMGDWMMDGDYWIKKHIKGQSNIINLSSLRITSMYDLIEEATPSIYYMLSWLESCFKNHVQISNPWKPYTPLYYIPNDTIYFNINLLSYKTYKEKVITEVDIK